MCGRVSAESDTLIAKAPHVIPSHQWDSLAVHLIPVVHTSDVVGNQKDSRREAVAFQQRPGISEHIEVAIVECQQDRTAEQWLFEGHRALPLFEADAVVT